ncbi:MAG: ribonucleotide-diphosphate reductase subunit beta [Bacteroidia bacterium]|nr:ribonucleotide-diphosphate reductase subunit beta [Bacteroidia bacterium]
MKQEHTHGVNKNMVTLFPITQKEMWDMYKRAEAGFWTAEEIDLSSDTSCWSEKLNDNERYYLKNTLAFFTVADEILAESLMVNFLKEVPFREARFFFGFQLTMMNIHAEAWALMIDTHLRDAEEKRKLFQTMETLPALAKKIMWMMQYSSSGSFAERLVALASMQSILLAGTISSVCRTGERGSMPGLSFAAEMVSRDTKLFSDFACLMYAQMKDKLPQQQAIEIITHAAKLEKDFVSEILPADLPGIKRDLMCSYIESLADSLARSLGYPKIYNAVNPFQFMEGPSADRSVRLFENRAEEFCKSGNSEAVEEELSDLDEDFNP